MAKYSIIADIGKGLVNMLRDKLVPEPVGKPEHIGICEPKNRGGFVVGIHPYDIKEDKNGQHQEKKSLPDGSIQDPPALIEIYYMISVSSKGEMETKAIDEARIIGKIIQVMNDNPRIPDRYMPQTTEYPRELVPITTLPLSMEEKVKVWTMFGESYKLSVFYVVGPVAIDSQNIRKPVKRVETIMLDSTQFIPRKIVQFETRIKEEDIDDEYTQHDDDDDDSGDDDSGDYDDSGDDDSRDDDGGDDDDLDLDDDDSGDDDSGDDDSGDDDGGDDDDLDLDDDDSGDDDGGDDDGGDDDDLDLDDDDSGDDDSGDDDDN